jgi:hypothetical protein
MNLLDQEGEDEHLGEDEALVERPLLQKPFYISKRKLKCILPLVDYELLVKGKLRSQTRMILVGAIFHKIGRNGSIHERFVRLSADFRYLTWEGSWFSRKPKEDRSGHGGGDIISISSLTSFSGPLSLPSSERSNDEAICQLRAAIQHDRHELLFPSLWRKQIVRFDHDTPAIQHLVSGHPTDPPGKLSPPEPSHVQLCRHLLLVLLLFPSLLIPFSRDHESKVFEAACDGDTRRVLQSLDRGLDIDRADKAGNTLLHWASEYGHTALVSRLLARGADASILDKVPPLASLPPP